MSLSHIALIIIAYTLDVGDITRKQRIRMKEWLKMRATLSHHCHRGDRLIDELQLTFPLDYKNYLGMNLNSFRKHMKMVSLPIFKQDTQKLRDATSPSCLLLYAI